MLDSADSLMMNITEDDNKYYNFAEKDLQIFFP